MRYFIDAAIDRIRMLIIYACAYIEVSVLRAYNDMPFIFAMKYMKHMKNRRK